MKNLSGWKSVVVHSERHYGNQTPPEKVQEYAYWELVRAFEVHNYAASFLSFHCTVWEMGHQYTDFYMSLNLIISDEPQKFPMHYIFRIQLGST